VPGTSQLSRERSVTDHSGQNSLSSGSIQVRVRVACDAASGASGPPWRPSLDNRSRRRRAPTRDPCARRVDRTRLAEHRFLDPASYRGRRRSDSTVGAPGGGVRVRKRPRLDLTFPERAASRARRSNRLPGVDVSNRPCFDLTSMNGFFVSASASSAGGANRPTAAGRARFLGPVIRVGI
jgi:hypothetical protein